MPKGKRPKYKIKLVDHDFVQGERRPEFEEAIKEAFKTSNFTGKGGAYGISNASLYFSPKLVPHTRHVVALDAEGKVVGAAFHVPAVKREKRTADGLGWFFTSPKLPSKERRQLANDIMDKAHETMRNAGLEHVYTTIGTREGAIFLQRYHGYKKGPEQPYNKPEIWEKKL